MVKHKYTTVIRFFEKNQNNISLWNYVTALRGDDTGIDLFKRAVTTVIRGECSNAFDFTYSASINRMASSDKQYAINSLQKAIEAVSYHTIVHCEMGLRALSSYYASRKSKENHVMASHLYSMAVAVLRRNAESYLSHLAEVHKLWG